MGGLKIEGPLYKLNFGVEGWHEKLVIDRLKTGFNFCFSETTFASFREIAEG